jgi:HAD superfamily hydrolase (TIGR01509 family)
MADLATARTWLLDFDNTLVALEPEVDWAASRVELEQYLRRAGIDDALFRAVPKGNLPLYERLRRRLLEAGASGAQAPADALSGISPMALLERASHLIESYEIRGAERARPLPGAIDLLRVLRVRGRSVAVVTSNSSRTVNHWLRRHADSSMVNFIVGRESVLALKPAPAMVNKALELCATAPADAVFVGDSEADAIAAHAADVAFFGIAPTEEQRARLGQAGAFEFFKTPGELVKRLGPEHR